eukprot:6184890-Pleurochrysis_carterae.AAC.1
MPYYCLLRSCWRVTKHIPSEYGLKVASSAACVFSLIFTQTCPLQARARPSNEGEECTPQGRHRCIACGTYVHEVWQGSHSIATQMLESSYLDSWHVLIVFCNAMYATINAGSLQVVCHVFHAAHELCASDERVISKKLRRAVRFASIKYKSKSSFPSSSKFLHGA